MCQAVHHAHQKGIIHRDLKPSNVLVAQYDTQPVPKIIDFGLAKAFGLKLTEKTMYTQYGQIVGTIDYMSPEQASFNQLDVDTRSDIYALGVLLYELLVGETPFDKKRLHTAAFDELLRIIRHEEPPRPSVRLSSHAMLPQIAANRKSEAKGLSLSMRGELDWIVMRSIEKERDRRYQSASALAEDICRYLANEPVSACPPSTAYRFHKFARKHRLALIVTALVFAALLLGLAGTGWALIEADAATEQTLVELREKEAFISRLNLQFRVEQFQRKQYFRFEEALSDFVKRLAGQFGGTHAEGEPAASKTVLKGNGGLLGSDDRGRPGHGRKSGAENVRLSVAAGLVHCQVGRSQIGLSRGPGTPKGVLPKVPQPAGLYSALCHLCLQGGT